MHERVNSTKIQRNATRHVTSNATRHITSNATDMLPAMQLDPATGEHLPWGKHPLQNSGHRRGGGGGGVEGGVFFWGGGATAQTLQYNVMYYRYSSQTVCVCCELRIFESFNDIVCLL